MYGCVATGTISVPVGGSITVMIDCGTGAYYGGTTTCSVCPHCGGSTSNHYIISEVRPTTASMPFKPYWPWLPWIARVIRRWRPYRPPIRYLRFLRPQTQAPRPKCRDPPKQHGDISNLRGDTERTNSNENGTSQVIRSRATVRES
jgi:hypothetical protein